VVFDLTLDELRERRSVKWRFKEPDVLPLWVAEMDVRLAEPIRAALAELVERGDTGYVTWDGLAEAYAGFAARRWRQELDPARMFVVPDVMWGIFEVLLVGTEPGDRVVINPPVYAPFFDTIRHARRRLVEVPLVRDADGMYGLDLAGLERAFAGGAQAYLLCSPHNPVGRVWTRAELEAVAALADRDRGGGRLRRGPVRRGRQHGGLRRRRAVAGRAAGRAARQPRPPRHVAGRAPAGAAVATRGRASDLSGLVGLLPARIRRPGRRLRAARPRRARARPAVRHRWRRHVRLNFATTPAVLDQAVQRMRAAIPPAEES
jgi:hypothetical protein